MRILKVVANIDFDIVDSCSLHFTSFFATPAGSRPPTPRDSRILIVVYHLADGLPLHPGRAK